MLFETPIYGVLCWIFGRPLEKVCELGMERCIWNTQYRGKLQRLLIGY